MKDGNNGGNPPTKAPVQSNKQLADAEGDGGVSRDDDGLVSTLGIPAVVDLKLQHNRKLSDAPAHQPGDCWQNNRADWLGGRRNTGSSWEKTAF